MGGLRAGAPVPVGGIRRVATASRDIRDFLTRSTRSSGPPPDPNLRLSATPTCEPLPNLNPTNDPNPTLSLGPPSSPSLSPGPARHPSPDLGIDPVQDPNPTSGAERSTRSSGAHTPFPSDLVPSLNPNLVPILGRVHMASSSPDPKPSPRPNPRPKRPRSPPDSEPARPPPPTRPITTCDLCLHRAAGNLSESSTMRHTCRSPQPPRPPVNATSRKRPRSPNSDHPDLQGIRRRPSTHPAGVR